MKIENLSRRELLKLTAAGVTTLPVCGWFSTLAAGAAEAAKATGQKHKSCIMLYMSGGPAQSHTFDLKSGSEYKAIDTAVPGIQISEYLPKIAQQMESCAILRGMSTGEASHPRGRYLMHTGWRQGQGGATYPSLGALVSHELGSIESELPNFVSVGGTFGAGYLGPKHAPLIVNDPTRGVENLKPYADLAEIDDRASLPQELDKNFLGDTKSQAVEAHQKGYQRAVQLMHSAKAKAFEIDKEPAKVKEAYGSGRFAQGCMLARRLVETGVPFVEVSLGGWDTHGGAATPVKNLSAQLDPGMGALIADLKERGLLDSTLVIWLGEFGRSPGKGTNHYARAWSTVLAGAGLKTGQVIGSTDTSGGTVKDRPIAVADFLATILDALGIHYSKRLETRTARPMNMVDKNPKVIEELF